MGRSAIAIIRISGPGSRKVLTNITLLNENQLEPRKAVLRKIIDPQSREILDNGLVIWFPGPKSFTGEDSAELHVHGGFAVISSILDSLHKIPNCRIAEPGIFINVLNM